MCEEPKRFESDNGSPAVWVLLDVTPYTPQYEGDTAFPLECVALTMEIALTYLADVVIGEKIFGNLLWSASPNNFGYWEGYEEGGPHRYLLLRQAILQEEVLQDRQMRHQEPLQRVIRPQQEPPPGQED